MSVLATLLHVLLQKYIALARLQRMGSDATQREIVCSRSRINEGEGNIAKSRDVRLYA